MRRTITLLLTAVVLLLGITTLAPLAAAAQGTGGQPLPVAAPNCSTAGDTEVCFTAKGILQSIQTPSGGSHYTENGEICHSATSQGTIDFEPCNRYQAKGKRVEGNQAVTPILRQFTYTYAGVTCTVDDTVVIANGEARHTIDNVSCR